MLSDKISVILSKRGSNPAIRCYRGRIRPRYQRLVPGVLLLATLATTFLFGHDRGYFYRSNYYPRLSIYDAHNFESSQTLAIAANLSPRNGFLLFIRQNFLSGGEKRHFLYGRFPVFNYALIKLSLLPFGDDASAGIHAARILMLLFFSGAAMLAFDAIRRLARDPWIALLAVTLAFSSTYLLFYNDAIDTEGSPMLFAMAMAFHGMVVFVRERRFRQLLLKTAIALLLDWHVYGLLLVFAAAGTAAEIVHARGSLRALGRSRYVGVGLFALLFGVAVLGFNLANEYRALGGETTFANLPSFDSMLRRTGTRPIGLDIRLDWNYFEKQFYRIGLLMSMPYALAVVVSTFLENVDNLENTYKYGMAYRVFVNCGVVLTACAMIGSIALHVRQRRRGTASRERESRGTWLFTALCASGFCYSVGLYQSTALHAQEVLVYIGIPLALYSMLGIAVRHLFGGRAVLALAGLGIAAFVVSCLQMSHIGHGEAEAERQRLLVRDFAAINRITRGQGNVCVLPSEVAGRLLYGARYAVDYYLAGSNLVYGNPTLGKCRAADFVLSTKRNQDAELLTPQNQLVFLHRSFDTIAFYEAQLRELVSREPLAQGTFDIYLDGRVLHYAKDPCTWEDTDGHFQLIIYPKDKTLLPTHRKPHDTFLINYRFARQGGVLFNGKCMHSITLPPYHIVGVHSAKFNRLKPDDDWNVWHSIELPAVREIASLKTRPL